MERAAPAELLRDGMDAGFPDLAPTLLILIQEKSAARQGSNCRSDPPRQTRGVRHAFQVAQLRHSHAGQFETDNHGTSQPRACKGRLRSRCYYTCNIGPAVST